MRTTIGIALALTGLAQYIIIGYNIFTLMLMILLCFVGGAISNPIMPRSQRSRDNLADLAQIERNRYFRKRE